ncbi:MAG: NAD-dependent epimerase/dehydratase family protein [Thermodesulfobacteriota bacterium]
MDGKTLQVVTGAFGFSGSYIAQRLLAEGNRVRTLTNSPARENPLGRSVETLPLCFDSPDLLARSLEGADVLYNTYWVRFNHRTFTHSQAVARTLALFDAAKKAGVRRVIHVSITNPDEGSSLEYFRGKAFLERKLSESGLSYTILRPAVLFGPEDILINNMAWMLRRFPFFFVFGDGRYRLAPIFVDDLAALAVHEAKREGNRVINAIGPETFSYRDLVATLSRIIGKERPLIPVPPALGYLASRVIGRLVDDVIVTREEIEGLMQGTLAVDAPPAGATRLTDWAKENRDRLGVRYHSELSRRRDRKKAYES